MNIRDLKYLTALAEHQHFGRAAESCFVSQPTLSTQIKKLEEELGVTLVERDNKKVMLTSIGRTISECAEDILNDVDEIKALAKQASDPESGTLTLGLIPTIGPYLLPYAVKAIRKRFPNIKLYLHEAQTHALTDMLKTGKIDAAIMALPIADERIESYPMYAEAFFAALPMGHKLGKAKILKPSQLKNTEMMLLEDGHCLRDQALDICHKMGSHEMSGFRATSLETLRQMVASGVGVTLLPTLAAESSQCTESGISIIPFSEPQPKRDIGVFYRPSSPRKDLFKEVGRTIADRLPKGLKNHLEVIYD